MESRLQAAGARANTLTLKMFDAIKKADAPPAEARTPNLELKKFIPLKRKIFHAFKTSLKPQQPAALIRDESQAPGQDSHI